MSARRITIIALALAVAAGPAACGGGDGGAARVPATAAEGVVVALCDASAAAADGDVDEARDRFEDVHQRVHAVADDVAGTSRQRAGELLRAKQVVESGLRDPRPERLATSLRDLAEATAAAAGADPPTCP